MFVLYNLGLITLFSILLLISYYVFETFFKIGFFDNKKINTYAIDIGAGIFYSLTSIGYVAILKTLYPDFSIPIYFIVPVVFLLLRSLNASLGSVLPILLYQLITEEMNSVTYYWMSSTFAVIVMYLFIDYKKEKFANISTHAFIAALSIISISTSITEYTGNFELILSTSIFTFIAWIVTYFVMRTAIRFSISANVLFESINFVHSSYLRHSLLDEYLADFIKSKKVSKALFGVIEIEFNKYKEEHKNREIINTILDKIEKPLKSTSILFNIDQNKYGFFTPIDGVDFKLKKLISENGKEMSIHNPLHSISKIIHNLDSVYKTTFDENIVVKTKAAVSIYGVQDNSLIQLEKNCLFTLSQINYQDEYKVRVFNPKDYKDAYRDMVNLRSLDDALSLDEYNLYDIPVIDRKGNKEFILSTFETQSSAEFIESPMTFIRANKWQNVFDRYISAAALKRYVPGEKRILFYSLFEASWYKDINDLDNKLEKWNVDKDDIIWFVSYEDVLRNKAFKNIKKIKEAGYKIGWYRFGNEAPIKNADMMSIYIINDKELWVTNQLNNNSILMSSREWTNEELKENKIKYFALNNKEAQNTLK